MIHAKITAGHGCLRLDGISHHPIQMFHSPRLGEHKFTQKHYHTVILKISPPSKIYPAPFLNEVVAKGAFNFSQKYAHLFMLQYI